MVLSTIQSSVQKYALWLSKQRHHPYAYHWEAQQNFQKNWDETAQNFAEMYENSLQNSKTQRIWQTQRWQPKRVMALLMRYNPETTKLMFQDLFDETKEVENRIGRFLFVCDDLMADYKKDHKTSIENNHHHDDYIMLAFYLAYRFPALYAPYDFNDFRAAMQRFQAKTA